MKIKRHKKSFKNEMRGISFVFNKDGSLYNRYILLDKFWNLDQSECSFYSVVKNYKIKNIMEKVDGSVASFIKLPNGKVVAKSKASFHSDQAIEIQKIYDKYDNIRNFVNWTLSNNIAAIFEYVSPTNRIVVPYANTDLILLRLRNNTTGEYLDINDYIDKLDGITVAKFENEKTLDELVELKDVIEGKEGWVVQFENGKMIKIKGKHYLNLHKLFTQELNQENTLILLILDEKIDDVISQLGEEKEKKAEIQKITDILNKSIRNISKEVDDMLKTYKPEHPESRKDFAINNNKKKYFSIAISTISGKGDKIELIKEYIKRETKHLDQARSWLKKQKL